MVPDDRDNAPDNTERSLSDSPLRTPVDLVYVLTDLAPGGTRTQLEHLISGLPPEEFDPHVIGLKEPEEPPQALEDAGATWESLELDPDADQPLHPESFYRLVERIAVRDPALVHTFLFHANLVGRAAARLALSPKLVSSIRVEEQGRSHHPILEGFTHGLADRIVCISRDVREQAMSVAGIPEGKMPVIPNGIDVEPSNPEDVPDGEDVLNKAGLEDGSPLLLAAGRLVEQKGFDLLIEAADSLRAEHPDLRLIICGSGKREDELRSAITERELSDHVALPGWRDDLLSWMEAADVFVLSSRWEGMPNALMEAAAQNVPVVATRTGGVEELMPDDVDTDFFLCEPGSADLIANALGRVLDDRNAHRDVARRIGNHVRNRFSVDRMVNRHRALYTRLLTRELATSVEGTPA